jgi:hypothetical protein
VVYWGVVGFYLLGSVEDPDPGSGAFFDAWVRDPGWVKNQDPGPGSGLDSPNHISESLETIFWVKYFNSLMRIRDPG